MNIDHLIALGYAALGGTIIGTEREWAQKSAGLRTHMLVSVGAALFLIALPDSGDDRTRVIQGVAAGVGFIGAGAILKDGARIEGITTATTIWIASAIGACCATGQVDVGIEGSVLAAFTLVALRRVEHWIAQLKGRRA